MHVLMVYMIWCCLWVLRVGVVLCRVLLFLECFLWVLYWVWCSCLFGFTCGCHVETNFCILGFVALWTMVALA